MISQGLSEIEIKYVFTCIVYSCRPNPKIFWGETPRYTCPSLTRNQKLKAANDQTPALSCILKYYTNRATRKRRKMWARMVNRAKVDTSLSLSYNNIE